MPGSLLGKSPMRRGFFRLWAVVSAVWVLLSLGMGLASGTWTEASWFGPALVVIGPPALLLAIGWAFAGFSGVVQRS